MSTVNRDSPVPAYFQIALDIRARIARKEWAVGERLPSETALAAAYDVSRITMRQALAEVVKDGYLHRRRGSGTFVNEHPVPLIHDLSLPHTLAGKWRRMGLDTSSKVIDAQTFPDPLPSVQESLRISASTPVAYLKRILLIGDEPTALNRSWFDHALCPGITSQSLIDNSLSRTLQERYGLVPTLANNWLEVIRCTRETAALLGNTVGMPMILLRSVSYLPDGRPLEYSSTEWLGDRIRFNFQSVFGDDGPSVRSSPGAAGLSEDALPF